MRYVAVKPGTRPWRCCPTRRGGLRTSRRYKGEEASSSARYFLARHALSEPGPAEVEPIGRFTASEQIEGARDEPGPAGLVAGAKSCAVVPMEVFIEEDVNYFPSRAGGRRPRNPLKTESGKISTRHTHGIGRALGLSAPSEASCPMEGRRQELPSREGSGRRYNTKSVLKRLEVPEPSYLGAARCRYCAGHPLVVVCCDAPPPSAQDLPHGSKGPEGHRESEKER